MGVGPVSRPALRPARQPLPLGAEWRPAPPAPPRPEAHLILLLEVVDALLLVGDGVVALGHLLLQPGNIFLQGGDLGIELALVGKQAPDFGLLLVDFLLEAEELFVHNPILAFEA